MNKSDITYSVVEYLAVLSARLSGYAKELNLIAWNGHDEKLDVNAPKKNGKTPIPEC